MTRQQFNEKWGNYLEPGFEDQGLEIDVPEVTAMLDEFFEKYVEEGFEYAQIKTKFKMARVYTNWNFTKNTYLEEKIEEILGWRTKK